MLSNVETSLSTSSWYGQPLVFFCVLSDLLPRFLRKSGLPLPSASFNFVLDKKIAPLLFDALVTLMTVIKAISIRRRHGGRNSRLVQTFLREGNGILVFDRVKFNAC
jgi:hypothetical protein